MISSTLDHQLETTSMISSTLNHQLGTTSMTSTTLDCNPEASRFVLPKLAQGPILQSIKPFERVVRNRSRMGGFCRLALDVLFVAKRDKKMWLLPLTLLLSLGNYVAR